MDRLGSTRVVTNGVIASGSQTVKARYDYLPFGAEIAASYGNRSSVAGYTVNQSTRQKFTGYERDIETGLDFAQARYYANTQGRFISADSVGGSALNPQTLNRYAYTGNNPLNNIDPSGHVFFGANFSSSQSYGNEAPAGYPDYAEAGLLSGEVEKLASFKDIIKQNQTADAADASDSSASTTVLHEQLHATTDDQDNLQDAVPGSPGMGRPFSIDPDGNADHDGPHVLSPPNGGKAVTIGALAGRVIYWNDQETAHGIFTVRVRPNVGEFIVVYKDLNSVSASIQKSLKKGVQGEGVSLQAGDVIGTVRAYARNDPQNRQSYGLHVTFVHRKYYDAFASSTKKDNSSTLGSRNPAYFFINPCGSGSPVRCQ